MWKSWLDWAAPRGSALTMQPGLHSSMLTWCCCHTMLCLCRCACSRLLQSDQPLAHAYTCLNVTCCQEQLDQSSGATDSFTAVAASIQCVSMQETRQALGVSLEGAVIVIDEAHNLVSAVNASHSASVSCKQLQLAHAQLSAYLERFVTRLAPGQSLWLGH